MASDGGGAGPARRPTEWKGLLVTALKVLVVVAVLSVFAALVGSVDWAQVGEAVRTLSLAQILILLAMLMLRQTLNAVPLALFAPGLSLRRSIVSDLSANLTAALAPPPGDVVLRVAMFRSWKVPLDTGVAGLGLNALIYYVLRFTAPVVGFVSLLLAVRFDEDYAVVAGVSALIAALLGVAVMLVVRAESSARWVGRTCARLVRRVRPAAASPEDWSDKMAEFRGLVEVQMRRGWAKALTALVAMVCVEALILLAAIRFLGIEADQLNGVEILAAFLVTYPLTALPFNGIGVLDAALYGILTQVGPGVDGNAVVAALVVWRLLTLAAPVVMGAVTLLAWRRA